MALSNKFFLCLHKEEIKTVLWGARTGPVWDEEIPPLTCKISVVLYPVLQHILPFKIIHMLCKFVTFMLLVNLKTLLQYWKLNYSLLVLYIHQTITNIHSNNPHNNLKLPLIVNDTVIQKLINGGNWRWVSTTQHPPPLLNCFLLYLYPTENYQQPLVSGPLSGKDTLTPKLV